LEKDIPVFSPLFGSKHKLFWTSATKQSNSGRPMNGQLIGIHIDLINYCTVNSFDQVQFINCLFPGLSSFVFIPIYLEWPRWQLLLDNLNDFIYSLSSSPILIMGDMNARIGEEQELDQNLAVNNVTYSRRSEDLSVNSNGRKFLQFCNINGLLILNGRSQSDLEGKFTFMSSQGSSTIDLAICNLDFLPLICSFQVLCMPDSDHMPICCNLSYSSASFYQDPRPQLFWKHNLSELYYEKVNLFLETIISESGHLGCEDLPFFWNNLSNVIFNAATSLKMHEKKTNNPANKRWFTYKCLRSRRNMYKALNIFRRSRTYCNLSFYLVSKKAFKRNCDFAKKQFENKIVQNLQNIQFPKQFWQAVNYFRENKHSTSSAISLIQWYDYFKKLYNPATLISPIHYAMPFFEDDLLDSDFSILDLNFILKKAKLNRSPGLDGIPYEFIQNSSVDFKLQLLKLYNYIFKTGNIPKEFRCAICIPLFKNKGSRDSPENHRGICLLNSWGKLFMSLLQFRLQGWLNAHNVLHEAQAGFRKNYSTNDNIFVLNHFIQSRLKDKGGKAYVFFVDFSAAFDSVNREFLLYKLSKLGLSYKFLIFLQNLYAKTNVSILTSHGFSNSFETTCGVRQGCPLSPTLFSLFINDLPTEIATGGFECFNSVINVLLFADDLALMAESRDDLQLMINELTNYVSSWGISINLNKSKIVIFRKGGQPSKLDKFSLQGKEIEIVKEYKYLGVLFNWNGKFSNYFKERAISSRIGIFSIWKLISSDSSVVSKFKVFDAIFRAILLYGAQTWGHIRSDEIEGVQRFFIRKLFSLPFNTPNYMLLLECGRHSIFLSGLKIHFKFLIRTSQTVNKDRFAFKCYVDSINKNTGWFTELTNLCNSAGLTNFLTGATTLAERIQNYELLLFRLHEQEKQALFDSVSNAKFHFFYQEVKKDFLMEDYLRNVNLPLSHLKLIFAARAEMLPVKFKPWIGNLSSLDSHCSFCNCGMVDSVSHCLFFCSAFNSYRQRYFGKPSLDGSQGHDVLGGSLGFDKLGKFLYEVFSFRKQNTAV
jgi:Reverse transcriptase (RNA-dependent DNA polymerase)/Endonuclease-reverse transcriptase